MLSERLNSLFAKRGGNLLSLLFSLLLAFFMWGMHSFSQTYSTFFSYKVKVESNIAGRAKSSESYNSVVLRGKSTGFYILQQRLSQKAHFGTIHLSVDSKQLKALQDRADFFYLRVEDVKDKIQESLGNDFELESFSTDTLYFQFPRQANRKVPVMARENVTFESQYTASGRMQLRPDSVVVYGDEAVVQKVDAVYTNVVAKRNADSPLQGMVGLQSVPGVRYSVDQVYYSLPVGRYFENTIETEINVVNAPSGAKVMVIPQRVTVSYKMLFENKKEADASDFQVVIDYNKIGESNVVKPYLVKRPANIFAVKIEPLFVECVVN